MTTLRALAMAGALAAAAALVVPPASGAGQPGTGEAVREVLSERLSNVPGKSLTAVKVEYAPGGRSASHRHSGAVLAYVLSGAIRSQLDDGPAKVYRAGESWFEPPGTHHRVSENASATQPARLLAVIVDDDGATLAAYDE
jgi:quercetin dioxygenase-like cupin family protein